MVTVCKQARSVVLATLLIVVAMIGVAPTAQADALSEPSIGVDGQVKPEWVGTEVDRNVDPNGFLPSTDMSAAAIPPVCIQAATGWSPVLGKYVQVMSSCNYSYRVKVLIAFGPDSACKTTAPFTTWRHYYGALARFDGLVLC